VAHPGFLLQCLWLNQYGARSTAGKNTDPFNRGDLIIAKHHNFLESASLYYSTSYL
jgi:hypothetical protein